MSERIRLTEELAETQTHLIEIRQDWEAHTRKEHPVKPKEGTVAQACHLCMTYKSGVRADEVNLADIEYELQQLDKRDTP